MDWRKKMAFLEEEDALIEEMQRLSFKNEETDPFTPLFLITDLDDYSDHLHLRPSQFHTLTKV